MSVDFLLGLLTALPFIYLLLNTAAMFVSANGEQSFSGNSEFYGFLSALTRSKVGATTSGKKSKIDIDVDDDDKAQKLEVCTDKNDNTVMCLPAGSDDYEDLKVPSDTETLAFEKNNYFARDAACPAPVNIDAFGLDIKISYEPWCDMARGIRPIIENLRVLLANPNS